MSTQTVLADIAAERLRQDEKFPDQHLPNGTQANLYNATVARQKQDMTQAKADRGTVTWLDVLVEEVAEATAEHEPTPLREELIQVAAVCVRWIEDIESRVEA